MNEQKEFARFRQQVEAHQVEFEGPQELTPPTPSLPLPSSSLSIQDTVTPGSCPVSVLLDIVVRRNREYFGRWKYCLVQASSSNQHHPTFPPPASQRMTQRSQST